MVRRSESQATATTFMFVGCLPWDVGMLSLIIATYNERENLEKLVEEIFSSLKGSEFELIIVDDNSPDGTGELADKIASTHSNIEVVHRQGKLGRGTAVLDGVKAANGEIIGVMDADFQHPPELLKTLLGMAEGGVDVVIASRYVEGGGAEGRTSFRDFVSRIALWLSHLFLPQTKGVRDTQSGYFLFKREAMDNVPLDVRGFTVLVGILAKGKYKTTVEVPYTFKTRAAGRSKLGSMEILSYVKLLLKLSEYRVLKFMGVGASGVLVNDGALWFLVAHGGVTPFAAALVSIEVSILSNFTLNNFWTFKHRKGDKDRHKLLKYHQSVVFGAVVNYLTFVLLVAAGSHFLAANTMGIVLGFFLNYLLSETYVWKHV